MKRYKFYFLFLLIFILIIFQACSNEEEKINISFFDQSDVFYVAMENTEDYILPNLEKKGFTFGGWFFDQKFQNQCTDIKLKDIRSDIVLYAKWTPNTYKLSIRYNDDQVHILNKQYNYKINLEEFSSDYEGYILSGWKTSIDGEDISYKINDTFLMPDYDIMIFPNWLPVMVNFETDDGDTIPSISYNDLKQDNVMPIPQKLGFKFLGWFLDKDFEQEFDLNIIPKNDITLIAKWEKKIEYCTVIFDTDGGSIIDNIECQKDSIVGQSTSPQKTGYEFLGWYKDDVIFDFSMPILKDITLFAKWKKIIEYCTVTFKDEENIISNQCQKGNKTNPPLSPQKIGYEFLGWYKDDMLFDFSTPINQDITLNAKWQELIYKITYINNGEHAEGLPQEFTITSSDIQLPNLTKAGFRFLGWFYNNEIYEKIPKGTSHDLTLEARFAVREISSISIHTKPEKISYFVNEQLDLKGLILEIKYDNGEIESLQNVNSLTASGYNPSVEGCQDVVVAYKGVETSFEVIVKAASIKHISARIRKTEYIEGQDIDLVDAKILLTYDNNDVKEIDLLSQYLDLDNLDMNEIGIQKVQVNYLSLSIEIEIYIKAKSLIEIKVLEYKTEYEYLEEISKEGIIELRYDNDTTESISLEQAQILGFDSAIIGEQTLIVKYIQNDITLTDYIKINICVPLKTIDYIELISFPKTQYDLSEELQVDNGFIRIVYNYQEIYPDELIALTADMVSGFNSQTACNSLELTVQYQGAECSYTVSIRDVLGEIFIFEEIDDGIAYSITGLKDNSITDLVIPTMYNGKPVQIIGDQAFENIMLHSINIPDNITYIGDNAFAFTQCRVAIIIEPRETQLMLGMFDFTVQADFYIMCDVNYLFEGLLQFSGNVLDINFFANDEDIITQLENLGITATLL